MKEETRLEILKEQYFPCENMDKEERDFLLRLIKECKDINDSKYLKNKKGSLVELHMRKKEKDLISFNGSLSYEEENRSIQGNIYYINDEIIFDMKTQRLCVDDINKEYKTLDIFNIDEEGIHILSRYKDETKLYERTIKPKTKRKRK